MDNLTVTELESKNRDELLGIAKELDLSGCSNLKKDEMILRILQANAEKEGNILTSGILDIVEEGYGFLRAGGLRPSNNDVYVSQSQIRRFGLRTGDMVTGQVRPPKNGEKYFGLLRVEMFNGVDPEVARPRPSFDDVSGKLYYH